ncbi:MAG: hypothetical protein LBB75_02195 [Oscillospiraceae bacterium]|jgi:hypothetical protein|nr:hypothetical protein [Oscillospiraceae bacterium]
MKNVDMYGFAQKVFQCPYGYFHQKESHSQQSLAGYGFAHFLARLSSGENCGKQIYDRDLFTDREKFSIFADELQYAAQVFTNRLELRKEEYIQLLKKRGVLNHAEEERFLDLYKLLRAYGEVDEFPVELLRPEAGRKMDAMLDRLNVLIEKTSQSGGEG